MSSSPKHRGTAQIFSAAAALLALTAVPALASTLASTPAAAPAEPSFAAPDAVPVLVTEPDDHWKAVRDFIGSAKSTLDMTMYELADDTAQRDLAADAARGVTVRVILDQNRQKKHNQPAFDYLSSHGVQVRWAPAGFKASHQKTITADRTASLILSGNLVSRYYARSRDFGVVDHDRADVAAIERVFQADFTGTAVTPSPGDDLVWSLSNTPDGLLSLINGAQFSLAVENDAMADNTVVAALAAAAKRGVDVTITMTDRARWKGAFDTLAEAGAQVSVYSRRDNLYIHAKVVIADGVTAFVGSENFSDDAAGKNRELGLITADPAILSSLARTLCADHAGAEVWET